MTRINALVDHEARLRFYLDISFVIPDNFVDIDEMASSPESFLERYGWAPIGDDAIRVQIVIGSHRYCVIAAYTPFGFICWEIYTDENIDAVKFQEFLNGRLRLALRPRLFGLIDNARIHKTEESLQALEVEFNGRYMFSVSYCPIDKPIERGFSCVKKYIRDNEIAALNSPIRMINEAFQLYSVFGERGDCAYNHFKTYYDNHIAYVNEF